LNRNGPPGRASRRRAARAVRYRFDRRVMSGLTGRRRRLGAWVLGS